MSKSRNISFLIPQYLLDQIQKRSVVNGRSRNAEIRYLVLLGLEYAGDKDTVIQLPEEGWVRGIGRIDADVEAALIERSRTYQRSLGRELVRLLAHAIQVSTDRDLALIEDWMSRQGRSEPALQ